MSTIRQNEKCQIKVPSKLVDSDYGTKVNKTRKKTKNKEKSEEVSGEAENRGIEVDEVNKDKEEDDLVCPEPGTKCNVSETKNADNSYVKALNQRLDNKLKLIPAEVEEDGVEVDLSVCLERVEPTKLPLWVKFKSLPLEAWSAKEISAIASRLGNPLLMDVTTQMCNLGNGRVGFARVLIEVEACKGLPDQIKIVYKNNDNMGVNVEGGIGNSSAIHEVGKDKNVENGSPSTRNKWNVNQDVVDSIRRSANKLSIMIDDPGDEGTKEDVNEVHDV
nr:RNA-directed DNA polymerase, eukaryota, reverse transcriptase zinc-binding domain protein [Tanacetum cinerariifolium]